MFEYWSLFSSAFAGFVVLGFLIYLMGNRRTRSEERKYETYTCGEPFEKVRINPDNFYTAIKKGLGIRDIREIHSGRLSDYLLWLFVGIVLMVVMVLWL